MRTIAERWYVRIYLAITVLLLLASLIGWQLSPTATLIALGVGVVFLGLPHGALDPLVAHRAFSDRPGYTSIIFYSVYLALVLNYWLLWSRYPTLGLTFFLLIAAFHFGSDWELRGNFVTRCAYGLAIITLPSVRFPPDVASIYAMLGTGHAALLVTLSRGFAPVAVGVALIGATFQFKQRTTDIVELLTIVASALLLEPLVFFTCYFALLHSPRHLLETAEGLGLTTLKHIYQTTLPVVLATLLLAGIAYGLLPRISIDARFLRIVFIGLAALTVPHMLLDTLVHTETNGA